MNMAHEVCAPKELQVQIGWRRQNKNSKQKKVYKCDRHWRKVTQRLI
jgi:hypothetical protein